MRKMTSATFQEDSIMQKHSTRKYAAHSDFDLYGDMIKIRDAFTDTAKDARGKAAEVLTQSYNDVKTKTSDIQELMSDYVTEKPIKSIGLALLSGALLGAFMMRRKVKYRRTNTQ
jgi:ElaB/YqjD/DUF883 family membrane-anchored ribosome-binding protein